MATQLIAFWFQFVFACFSATKSATMETVPSATMTDTELWSEKDVETMEMENVFRKMRLSQKVPTKMICMEHAKRAAMVQT